MLGVIYAFKVAKEAVSLHGLLSDDNLLQIKNLTLSSQKHLKYVKLYLSIHVFVSHNICL